MLQHPCTIESYHFSNFQSCQFIGYENTSDLGMEKLDFQML